MLNARNLSTTFPKSTNLYFNFSELRQPGADEDGDDNMGGEEQSEGEDAEEIANRIRLARGNNIDKYRFRISGTGTAGAVLARSTLIKR